MKKVFQKINWIINRFRKPSENKWEKYDVRLITFTELMSTGKRINHRMTISGNQMTCSLIEHIIRRQKWISKYDSTTLRTESEFELLRGSPPNKIDSGKYAQTLLEAAQTKQGFATKT